ncbi:MAG: type II CAAX prenyl endopeptidase Rce1 family protein [Phycisphaerales bacterium JB043]
MGARAEKHERGAGASEGVALDEGYARESTRPLHVLVFLLPWLVVAEIGSILMSGSDHSQEILAHRLLHDFFQVFGMSSLHLPAITMVVVLVIQHVLSKHGWRVRPGVLAGMALESLWWVLPLVVLAQVFSSVMGGDQALQEGVEAVRELPWFSRAMIALQAGLYEELLFRLILMTALHLILVDIAGLAKVPANIAVVVVAALAFALYHREADGFVFYLASGVYFGTLFLWRGFGIVVVVHALYDLIALLGPGSGG